MPLCAALPLAGMVQRVMDAHAATTTLLPLALADAPGAAAASAGADPVAFGVSRLAVWELALQARLPLVILFWGCGAAVLALRMLLGLLWVRHRSPPARGSTCIGRRGSTLWPRASACAGRYGQADGCAGQKMDVLGKQIDKESHAADKVVRGLIQEALAKGLASPAPM